MKIKKILASLLAGVIAVTAISTVSISAVTKEQKAETIVYDVSERGWQVEWKPTVEIITTIKDVVDTTFTEPVTITIIKGTQVNSYTGKNFVFIKSGVSTGDQINLGLFNEDDKVTIKLSQTILSDEFLSERKAKEELESPTKTWNLATITSPSSSENVFTKLIDHMKLINGKVIRMENKGRELEFDENATISLNDEKIVPFLGLAIVNAVGDKKGAKIKFTFTPDTVYDSIDKDTFGPTLDYNEIAGSMKDLAIAPAKTFEWKDKDGIKHFSSEFSGKTQGAAEIVNNTATFDWDSIVAGSGLSINSIGLVNDIVMGSAKERTLILEKVEIIIPAKTYNDLSAGAGQTETEEVITSAADKVETDATEPVDNPTTGNSPIALAAIPVAIGAAAILAKKRK